MFVFLVGLWCYCRRFLVRLLVFAAAATTLKAEAKQISNSYK